MIHSFDTDLAEKHGIEAAVILYNIDFWIRKNRANERHFYDGKYWTYNSVKAWQELFPYITRDVIRKRLDYLVDKGILIRGNYNKDRRDRTSWYTIDFGALHLATEPNAVVPGANSSIITDSKRTDVNIDDAKASGELFTEDDAQPIKQDVPRGTKKKADGSYQPIIDHWLKVMHPGWDFRAVHGKAVKSLIGKIRATLKNSGRHDIADSDVVDFFKVMGNRLPEWFKDKDLLVIDSKYNEIITQIRNGQQRPGKSVAETRTTDTSWIDHLYGGTTTQ
jgi:hypothetical protein